MNLLTAQVLINIITEEMNMPPNTVVVRNQNFVLPNDDGLYIVVGMVSTQVMANNWYMVPETVNSVTTQHQVNQVQTKETMQIDVISRSNDALTRNWEIIAALQSEYSQQQQELNNFKIFKTPISFLDTSDSEGGSQLNKYTLSFNCFVWYRKDKIMNSPLGDYFDEFSIAANDEATLGTSKAPAFEFEVDSETPAPPYP